MADYLVIDQNLGYFTLFIFIISIHFLFFLRIFIPWLEKNSFHDSFSTVKTRNYIVLGELLKDHKEQFNSSIEGIERDFYLKMKIMMISVVSFLYVETITLFFTLNQVFAQTIRYGTLTLIVFSVVYMFLSISLTNYYEIVWYQILIAEYPNLQFSLKDKISGRSNKIIYQIARDYIQKLHNNPTYSIFDNKMIDMINESSKYNKSEKSVEKTSEKFRLDHLWYDRNLIYDNKHEKYKGSLIFIQLSFLLLLMGTLTKLVVIDKREVFPECYLIIIMSSLMIMGFASFLYQKWFNIPNLNIDKIIEFLSDQDVSDNLEDPYLTMREAIDSLLNTNFDQNIAIHYRS